MTDAYITPGFASAPYRVETYPIGSCVVNNQGFNVLAFRNRPGAKFTTREQAEKICDLWNDRTPTCCSDAPSPEKLTAIYKKANGEDTGKPQALTTERIFRAMLAMLDYVPARMTGLDSAQAAQQ